MRMPRKFGFSRVRGAPEIGFKALDLDLKHNRIWRSQSFIERSRMGLAGARTWRRIR